MAHQDWLTPAAAPQPSMYDTVAPTAAAPMYEMRPLTLGELLDRSFSIYRKRFWLYAGIASIAAVVELVISGAGRVLVHRTTSTPLLQMQSMMAVTYIAAFVYFFIYAVTQAATCWAMAETYLGRPATVGSSLKAVRGKWYAWIGIALWQMWSAMWLPVVLFVPLVVLGTMGVLRGGGAVLVGVFAVVAVIGCMVYGVWAFLRNALAIPAKVVEGMPVRAAMRRSKTLIKGAVGRAFVLALIVFALYIVIGVAESPLSIFILTAQRTGHMTTGQVISEALVLLLNFAARLLVTPVFSIGCCLIYFDQRVRNEAFDLELLLGAEGMPAGAGMAAWGGAPGQPAYAAAGYAPGGSGEPGNYGQPGGYGYGQAPAYGGAPVQYAPGGYGTAAYTPATYAPVTYGAGPTGTAAEPVAEAGADGLRSEAIAQPPASGPAEAHGGDTAGGDAPEV